MTNVHAPDFAPLLRDHSSMLALTAPPALCKTARPTDQPPDRPANRQASGPPGRLPARLCQRGAARRLVPGPLLALRRKQRRRDGVGRNRDDSMWQTAHSRANK